MTHKPKFLTVRLALSTGEKIHGKVLKSTGMYDSLIPEGKKRPIKVYRDNIIQLVVELDAQENQRLSKLPADQRTLQVAEILLDYKLEKLAEMTLVRWMELYASPPASPRALNEARIMALPEEQQKAIRAQYETYKKSHEKQAQEAKKRRAAWLDAAGGLYATRKAKLPRSLGGKTGKIKPARRYILPTTQQVDFAMEVADKWFVAMKKITPKAHLVETEHFRIYSGWPKSDDKALVGIYEKLYKALCKQFGIPPEENIWIGKLPIYAFWTKAEFVNFSIQVVQLPPSTAQGAGGYAGFRSQGHSIHRYVVLGPVKQEGQTNLTKARIWFFELLTHESSHAFMGRFQSENTIANWANEGIAETMSSTLVPKSRASKLHVDAAKETLKGHAVWGLFDVSNIPMDGFHYGASQSLVRYLIARDQKKFIQFIMLMKQGKSDKEALKEAYGADRDTIVASWMKYLKKKYGR